MVVRAELILFVVALALAALAFAFAMPYRTFRWRIPSAVALCVIAGLAPLLMYVALDPARARGQALWEWSAVGGPTIQASYRLDGLAAIGVGIGALYVAAALVATTRVSALPELFAGLYPFVPWGYRSEEAGERESLRGLLTMPAGFGATLVLCRILGVTRIDLATLGLPAIISPALIAVIVAALALRFILRRSRPGLRRRIALSVLVLVVVQAYPFLHWSHLILVAMLLTIAYAAAVSLALPEQWAISRYDVVLAALWIALATGSPTALAGALVVLAGGGLAAVADAFWMPPHRSYITAMASSTVIVVAARTARVFLPELTTLSTRLDAVVKAADPVPIAAASFRALAGSATTASGVFALFEERAGVWLALTLIATLLVWSVR